MRSIVFILIMAAGAGVFFNQGTVLSTSTPETGTTAKIEPESVADHCTRAIPQVWEHLRDAGEDVGGIKGKLGFAAFNHVATGYCICNQNRFGDNRSDPEKALFGTLAGLNLKMGFSKHFTKSQRESLRRDSEKLGRRYKSTIERNPGWLKTINDSFRTCRKEQMLKVDLSAIGM